MKRVKTIVKIKKILDFRNSVCWSKKNAQQNVWRFPVSVGRHVTNFDIFLNTDRILGGYCDFCGHVILRLVTWS